MSDEQQPTVQYSANPQQTSGKAIASMILGICSLLMCIAYGLPGIICGFLAILFAKHANQRIASGLAPESSAGMAKAGKICGWIGLSLSMIVLLFLIAVFVLGLLGVVAAGAAGAAGAAPTLLP
ncbi:MAG: DUF4190 domain-containing protein [Phycisphaerales bacterium]|nr:DUF4190 domain-containing protein [Phycisphaerales bacterium]